MEFSPSHSRASVTPHMTTIASNERPVARRTMVITVATVMLAAAVAQGFGRFTFGVLLPQVRNDLLGGSTAVAGFIQTANTGAYLVGALLIGSVSARLTPVMSVRLGLTLSVSGLITAVFAPNAAVLTVALVAMGLGGAAIWIPSPGIAAAVVAPKNRGLAVGLSGAGVGIGIVFSGYLNQVVVARGGDWRDVYSVHSVLGVLAIVAVIVVLGASRSASQPSGGFGGFAVLRQVEGWKPITICYFVYGFGYLLILAFLVARLVDDSGFGTERASLIFSITGACTIAGGIALGKISDRLGRRRTLMVGFPIWSVATALLLTGRLWLVVVGAITVGILFGGLPSVIAAYLLDRTDTATYGPSYAAATFAFGLAQVMSPYIGGLIAQWQGSFAPVFVMSATAMMFGAVSAWFLPKGS